MQQQYYITGDILNAAVAKGYSVGFKPVMTEGLVHRFCFVSIADDGALAAATLVKPLDLAKMGWKMFWQGMYTQLTKKVKA